ncbi:5-oxoprolinase subunit PxpB [Paenibacillus sp. GCM10012307]|uniref:5-oxoprolinase subunit PxpB n=1 Tax=Paenibacillus roseus TaxID=2798579 RepID=A0A934MMZ5_9BACL|nr:5-oxoprolinase subunit PxpB [Paenibacillus roseus]MBJ6363910.1 5-oxoprolinase subunit PxpB [Paenibacillus roseus]
MMHVEYAFNIEGETLRVFPLGDRAIVLAVATGNKQTWQMLARIAHRLRSSSPSWLEDIVPAYETVTLYYNPFQLMKEERENDRGMALREENKLPYKIALDRIEGLLKMSEGEADETASRLVHIPVCYGGNFGPDLEEAAARSGVSAEAYAALHAEAEYTVAMLGFMPGFPYLTGLPERLAQPRRAEPRKSVAAGSIAVAARQTGIYPVSVPGGWQIIGRTSVRLFDKTKEEPALLRAGDRVKFVAVREHELDREGKWIV